MDRNLVLAIVISVVIILGFQYFYQAFSPPTPKKAPATTEAGRTTPPVPPPEPEKRIQEPAAPSTPPVKASEPEIGGQTVVVPAAEVRVKVDGPIFEAVLSSKGGRIVTFRLKDYKKKLDGSELINFFPGHGPDTAGPVIGFTRREEEFDDAALDFTLDSKATAITLGEKGQAQSVTFTTATRGLTISKTYTFHPDNYLVDFSFTVTNNSGEERSYLVKFPWKKEYLGEGQEQFAWNSSEILLNNVLKDYYFKDIKGEEEPSGKVGWAGLGDVYFFKALVFTEKPAAKVRLFQPTKQGVAEIWVHYGALDLPAGKPVATNLALYLGPKERAALSHAGHELSRALVYSSYAVLEFMSESLMKFLRFCYSGFEVAGIRVPGIHNYGVVIILLTIFIKILFIPLTHKSMKSMQRMQELQPQIAKLKEKYKDDKTALNKATMELFKDQKVNPLGSCWPMFLQLPVFIALYQTLAYAIELRHAPFVCIPSIYLCINDLSAPDPYYVTPIIMGGTMALQQWMTPSAGDPTQKKMMLLMPVVFTYLFLSFPSGLVLYWLVSNLLSIGQQVITNRMSK